MALTPVGKNRKFSGNAGCGHVRHKAKREQSDSNGQKTQRESGPVQETSGRVRRLWSAMPNNRTPLKPVD
jgi:hypothetical protein